MDKKINLALIYGSTREGRFCDTVADWAAAQIDRQQDFSLDRIDPAALSLPVRLENKRGAGLVALAKRIEQADAFVVVTPEYNHGYPAALKFLIDCFYSEWQAKPVAFVCYGGVSGGLRAVEQLRQVFAELHAMTIRDSVSFANFWQHFDDKGALHNPGNAEKSMATVLAGLKWWARALRDARRARPYGDLAV